METMTAQQYVQHAAATAIITRPNHLQLTLASTGMEDHVIARDTVPLQHLPPRPLPRGAPSLPTVPHPRESTTQTSMSSNNHHS